MVQASDATWLAVLPDMRGFGPALIKGAGSDADKAGKSVGQRFGKAMVVGTAAIGGAALATGAALYKVGEVFDDVTDTIRTGTGAQGKALDDMVSIAKNVGTKVPAEFDKIGSVVADVNTRMGLSGDTLEKVSSQYLEAGRLLGEDIDIGKTSAAFNAFKIEGEDVSAAMDHLFQVSQATGMGMNELADAAAKNAPAMQTLGFSFEETTAMVGSFDKAGLNSSAIMASMSKGLVTLAKDGEEPAAAFKRVQGEIAGFIEKGDEAGALNLASKVFGTRGATQFIGAIKAGALNLDDMSKAAGQTGDTILGVGEDTADFAEQWMMFKNNVLVWLEPLASKVFGVLGTAMGEVTAGVTAFGAAWAANDGDITSSGIPGMFERLAYWGRQAFDYVQNTALPAAKDFGKLLSDSFGPAIERVGNFIRDTLVPNLQGFGGELGGGSFTALQNVGGFLSTDLIPKLGQLSTWLLDNWDKIANIATGIGVLLLPALARAGFAALLSAGQQVTAWVMASGGAISSGAVYLAQSYVIIGTWVANSLAAMKSAAETAYVWALYKIEAIKAAGVYVAQSLRIAAAWVAMSAAAVASGIRTAAVWLVSVVGSAIVGAASFLVSAGIVVGGWVLMGVQSMIQAGRMAAAWFIALGPIGWVIAAVVGLAAIIIANWDKISSFTRYLWENNVKPVFSAMSNFIMNDVPNAFRAGIGFIGKVWDGLRDLAKAPVKFVVDTVLNDGLIGGLNNIGGFLGLPKIPRIPLPAGFAEGGILPGTSSWRNGDTQLTPMRPGEGVYVSEVMRDPYERARLFALNRAGMNGLSIASARAALGEGYAMGGIVAPLKNLAVTQGYNRVHKGIDYAASVGTPVFATQDGVVTHSGPGARAPGVWGGQEVHVLGNGIETWFAHLSALGARVGDRVKAGQQIAASGNTGISSGPHLHFGVFNGGWPNDVDPSGYLGGAGVPTGGTPGSGGWNPIAGIIGGLMDSFKRAFPAAGFIADVAIGMGKKLLDGAVDFITGKGGGGDKNVSGSAAGPSYLYDSGGVLNPGLTQVLNNSRKPEAIYTNSQNSALQALAARGASGSVVALHPDDRALLREVAEVGRQPLRAHLNGREFLTATRNIRTT